LTNLDADYDKNASESTVKERFSALLSDSQMQLAYCPVTTAGNWWPDEHFYDRSQPLPW